MFQRVQISAAIQSAKDATQVSEKLKTFTINITP